jgi:hypothetical protein
MKFTRFQDSTHKYYAMSRLCMMISSCEESKQESKGTRVIALVGPACLSKCIRTSVLAECDDEE